MGRVILSNTLGLLTVNQMIGKIRLLETWKALNIKNHTLGHIFQPYSYGIKDKIRGKK